MIAVAHPHRPEVGWIRRILGPFHVTGVFWYWFPTLAPKLLPRWAFVPVETGFAVAFFIFLHNIRRALVANLAVALGPAGFWRSRWRAFRTMYDFALGYGDRHEHYVYPRRFEVRQEDPEIWRELSRRRRGTILVTAHLGAWNMLQHAAPATLERRVHVVREIEIDPAAQAHVERLLAELGDPNCVTHFATDDPRLGLELKQALEDGHVVALQADRPRPGRRNVTVRLFGRETLFPAGPAVLARLAGATLVPVFCFRESHYLYRAVFRPAIEVPVTDDKDADVETATRALAREVEWAILHRPHQWYAFGPIWPEPPAADGPAGVGSAG
jgi:lauroyl/myristoyl acyltransferase